MNVETIVKECVNEMLPILDNKRWKGDRKKPLLDANNFNVVLNSVALKLGVKLKKGTIFKVFHEPKKIYSPTNINGIDHYPIEVQWGYRKRRSNKKLSSEEIYLTHKEYFMLFRERGWKEIKKTNAPHIGKKLLDCIERVFTLIVQKYYNFMCFLKWKNLPVGTKLLVRSCTIDLLNLNEYEIDVNPNSLKIAELKYVYFPNYSFFAWVDFSDKNDNNMTDGSIIPWECIVGIQKGSV